MKACIICKQQSFLKTRQEMLPMKKSKKNLAAFSFEDFFFFFINRQLIGMTVPQGNQTAAEENWSVIGVLWQFSIHSGIGHDCWEMNSNPLCKLDFFHSF